MQVCSGYRAQHGKGRVEKERESQVQGIPSSLEVRSRVCSGCRARQGG